MLQSRQTVWLYLEGTVERLTEAEMSLLQEILRRESASVRELAEAIYGSIADSKTAAVLKLLQRIMAKGFIECCRDQRPHVYRPLVSQDEYLQMRLQEMADEHCGGELAPLATTLLQSKGFNRSQQRQLRELIDRLWPEADDGSKRKRRHD